MHLRRTNTWCLGIIFLLIIPNISAIIINEVELNPAGDDTGNEYIEFYSKDEINLTEYKIINNDGNELQLNQTFTGYFVFTFEKQWLDNSDEKISLYKNNHLP